MKQIIDKKTYNTETATCIFDYWNGLSHSDFNNLRLDFYITKKGAFFVHGIGGAMTDFGRNTNGGNTRSSGESIRALSKSEALEWLTDLMATEAIEKYFSDMIEEA